MRRLCKIPAALAATSLLLVVAASPAPAATTTASCTASGHTNNDTATYSLSGGYHVWGTATYRFGGSGTGGKSNMNIRIYASQVLKYAYNSPDDRQNNITYSQGLGGTKTLPSQAESITFQAIFDVFGSDPSCTASSPTF